MMSTLARFAQISSCSTAAARNVSAAQTSGCWPDALSRLASLPTVVVFPVPLTPTIIVTCGWWPFGAAVSTASNTLRISSFTRSRRLSPWRARERTAVTMRSVAARPTSADTSSSSSASMVSTLIGRVRSSAVSACSTISSKRVTICCLVRVRLSRSLSKNPKSQTPNNNNGGTENTELFNPVTFVSPWFVALTGFRLLRPQHHIVQRRARILAAGKQLGYLSRDRKLHAMACGQRQRRIGRSHLFGHHLHARQHIRQRAATRQLDANVAIATERTRACQHQVAEA